MLGNIMDFSSCAIWIGFHKSSHICNYHFLLYSTNEGLPISCAAANGHEQIIVYLLDSGAFTTEKCPEKV